MPGRKTININGNREILILDAEIINSLLTMDDAISLMNDAFESNYRKHSHIPLRSVVSNQDNSINLFFKPAFDSTLSNFSVKLITQNEANREFGLPTINGLVVLFDNITGEAVALMDGNYITSLRTGAVAGLATKYLGRKDSKKLAIFGCGAQGRTQMQAVMEVREIAEVYLFDTDKAAIDSFISDMESTSNASLIGCNNLEVLKDVDIICTATGARKPLFGTEHLKRGVHINAIGAYKPDMQEIDSEIIKMSSLFVDQREACLAEPGDILIPLKEGLIRSDHILADLGELAAEKHIGRKSEEEFTVFKSVGLAVQDLFVANDLYLRSSRNM